MGFIQFINHLFTDNRVTARHPLKEGKPQVCMIIKEVRGLVKVKFADGYIATLNKSELINGKIK
jgi:hypothetical protein